MTTDIHDLDQYIGQYVSVTQGEGGGSGFVVDVADQVDYIPEPIRWITFDYGMGWPISADTEIVMDEPPTGQQAPEGVENPVQVIHLAMHADGQCPDEKRCLYIARARKGLRALRIWRMKQSDQYWKNQYVNRLRRLLDDPVSVGDILREARHEGCPPHIQDHMQAIVDRAAEGTP